VHIWWVSATASVSRNIDRVGGLFNAGRDVNCADTFLDSRLRWGFPMSYYKEDDDEMIQSMVDCGGMTKEMAKDKVGRMWLRQISLRPKSPGHMLTE